MILVGDFRKGTTFEMEDEPYIVLDFQHVKPGKGAAFVRTKYKNLKTGAIREDAFNPGDRFPRAHIETKEMQYLYNDGEFYYFMDNETFEQIPLTYEQIEEAIVYLKENTNAIIKFYQGQPFQVDAPNFVELQITETEPGIRGDTASSVTKTATVETGAVVNVPLFVNEGDIIRIDTRTGEYMSRI